MDMQKVRGLATVFGIDTKPIEASCQTSFGTDSNAFNAKLTQRVAQACEAFAAEITAAPPSRGGRLGGGWRS